MKKIVVDTSVIVDYLRADVGVFEKLVKMSKKKSVVIYLPTVVILELWKGRSMDNEDIERNVKRVLKTLKTISLTQQLARSAGKLMREGQVESYMDATVAATALYLDAQLATRNIKHFRKVGELKLFKT